MDFDEKSIGGFHVKEIALRNESKNISLNDVQYEVVAFLRMVMNKIHFKCCQERILRKV